MARHKRRGIVSRVRSVVRRAGRGVRLALGMTSPRTPGTRTFPIPPRRRKRNPLGGMRGAQWVQWGAGFALGWVFVDFVYGRLVRRALPAQMQTPLGHVAAKAALAAISAWAFHQARCDVSAVQGFRWGVTASVILEAVSGLTGGGIRLPQPQPAQGIAPRVPSAALPQRTNQPQTTTPTNSTQGGAQ